MPKLTKPDIHGRTLEYLDLPKKDRGCYVDELLGRELQHAASDPLPYGTPRLRRLDKPVHTLALTVGESFEPLLQVVCVLNPKRVVLILNNLYEGGSGLAHGETLKKRMMKLAQAPDLPADIQKPQLQDSDFDLAELDADTPIDVFRALQALLQKAEAQPPNGYTNAVDITGAKKSMVVGAFLYAAHSSLPITYVDFDKYDPEKGRTFGYSCKIGRVADPYAAFHLRDWEHVRRFYDNYNFRGACELIGTAATRDEPGSGILGAMSRPQEAGTPARTLYEKEDIENTERLIRVLRMYEAWDNGDYHHANEIAGGFEPTLSQEIIPTAIEKLGGWPSAAGIANPGQAALHLLTTHLELKRGTKNPTDSIFGQPSKLFAYVCDETAKIQRLITKNEDYRSAYLRAAGLEEFLLKARLGLCWLEDEVVIAIGKQAAVLPSALSDQDRATWFGELVEHSGADAMRETLRRIGALGLKRNTATIQLAYTAPTLGEYWIGTSLDIDGLRSSDKRPVFTKLRGEAIHTHLYLPRPIAEAALELVQTAVEEFVHFWLDYFHPGTLRAAATMVSTAPSWSHLCESCELGFLPPKLRD